MSDAKTGRIVVGVIVAIYLAFVFVSFAKHEAQDDRQGHQQETQADPGDSAAAKSTVVDVEPNTPPEENPCEQRDGDNWQDLCQQWRMAEAAEDLTRLTLTQIGVTVFEVALLVAVLVYTAKATLANTEANRLTKQSFVAEQRPWMSVEGIEKASPLVWRDGEGRITFSFFFKNYGQSLAIQVQIRTRVVAKFATLREDIFKEFSKSNRERPLSFGGVTVFPGEIFKTTEGISIPKEEIDQYFADAAAISHGD